jgi:hypothetical protein
MNNEQRLPGVSARRVIVRACSARATGRGARAYFAPRAGACFRPCGGSGDTVAPWCSAADAGATSRSWC